MHVTRKRLMHFVLALILSIAGTAAAEELPHGLLPGKPFDGTTLTFLICCPAAAQFAAWADSVPDFTELTGINVVFTNDPLTGLREKIITESIGNPGSWDVTIYFETWGPSLVNFLQPVEDFADTWIPNVDDYPPATIGMATLDGKLYGLPARSHVMMFFYRQDVLDALNLPVPTTWDEVESTAQVIDDSDLGVRGITMNWAQQGGGISLIPWTNVLRAYGSDIFDEAWRPAFTTDAAIAATELYQRLLRHAPSGAVTYNEGDMRNSFASGEAAMALAWSWSFEIFQNPEFAVPDVIANTGYTAAIPGLEAPTQPVAMTWPVGISANSRNPEAALEWVKWMTNPELDAQAVASGTTVVANRLGTFFADDTNAAWGGFSRAMGDAFESATPLPIYQEFPEVADVLEGALSSIASGANVRSTLEAAERDVDAIMRRSGRY